MYDLLLIWTLGLILFHVLIHSVVQMKVLLVFLGLLCFVEQFSIQGGSMRVQAYVYHSGNMFKYLFGLFAKCGVFLNDFVTAMFRTFISTSDYLSVIWNDINFVSWLC